MPGKHVTFSDTNMVYSPIPPTPSPTFSTSSLPSTDGPRTPPSLYKATLPLPDGPVRIHPILGFQPNAPEISFDLCVKLAAMTNTSPPAYLSEKVLNQHATSPPTPVLTIIADNLPWSLTIIPSSQQFVTVLDVLEQLYSNLRLQVTKHEYGMESPEAQHRIGMAFSQRINRDPYTKKVEESKGLKRVDFLRGRNQFMGLSSTKKGPTTWFLDVR